MYLLCSLGFVVVALVEFAVIILIGRASEASSNKVECTTISKEKLRRRNVLKNTQKKIISVKPTSGIRNKIVDDKSQVLARKAGGNGYGNHSLNAIDFISFWLFVTLFALFNLAYWNLY